MLNRGVRFIKLFCLAMSLLPGFSYGDPASEDAFEAVMSKSRNISIDDSMTILNKSTRFEGAPAIGASLPSLPAEAFMCLECQGNAQELFEKLFTTSQTIAGKLYALLGIYLFNHEDHKEFELLAKGLNPDAPVTLWDNEKSQATDARSILAGIRDGSINVLVMGPWEPGGPLKPKLTPVLQNPQLAMAEQLGAERFYSEESMQILRRAPQFEGAFIGGCRPSLVAASFMRLYGGPEPKKHFEDLFNTSNTAGKLYALFGIYQFDHVEFNSLAKSIDHKESIVTVDDCLVYQVDVQFVLRAMQYTNSKDDSLGFSSLLPVRH